MSPTDIERLVRYGFTEDGAAGLIRAWQDPNIDLLLFYDPQELRQLGYSAADTFDAAWHDLGNKQADLYYRHGLTAHQGAVIESSEQARTNLNAGGTEAAEEYLSAPIPKDYLLNVLLEAKTPQEADALLDQYEQEARDGRLGTPDGIDTKIATLVAMQPPAVLDCDCP